MSIVTKEQNDLASQQVETVENKKKGIFTRQPASVSGRIAFWASVVGALGGVAGTLTLWLSQGYASQNLVIMAACALASAIILATRLRWAPVVSALLAGYRLYLTCIEPFVIESLAKPKGPNGGLAHFIMDVLVVACTLLALGASIAATAQNYRLGSRQIPRWLPSVINIIAGMAIGAIFIGVLSQPVVSSGTIYTNGVPTIHVGASNFDQTSVTISKGSKLLLVDDNSTVHDFFNGSWQNSAPAIAQEPGAPAVSNVQLKGNSVTIGPFAIAGTYHILCTIHRGMNLTIIVQ